MEVDVTFEARDGIAALPNFRKKPEV